MWTDWICTDDDCAQYMRKNGTVYELIETVWLVRTHDDIKEGTHEFCVVFDTVDITDFAEEERKSWASLGYDGDEYMNNDIVAELYLEDHCLSCSCVLVDVDSFAQAELFIKAFINNFDI